MTSWQTDLEDEGKWLGAEFRLGRCTGQWKWRYARPRFLWGVVILMLVLCGGFIPPFALTGPGRVVAACVVGDLLVLGVAISLPLAVVASQRPRLRFVVLAVASLVQTIPGLALLALFYPLLLGLSALTLKLFGTGVPALGFLPSLLALTVYSMLPILRNGVTGLLGVDAAYLEAADGVGMTRGQKLLRVELPLAAPVIMAGIRTAAVWTIGMATLSTTVGQTSLGNFIFPACRPRTGFPCWSDARPWWRWRLPSIGRSA